MTFVAFCPSLPPSKYAGDEPKLPHMTTHGILMPEVHLAACSFVNKLVNI
jgi:hypothetical protein